MHFTATDGLIVGLGLGGLLARQAVLPEWFTVAVMAGLVLLSSASKFTHSTDTLIGGRE
jgi:hypothetical protein